MMEFLIPLGLLGLLGIVALIIIYIIKPNYIIHHTSSNYVWKLSLKYRKKRIPTSKIRNILIFLCQLFALTVMAGILAMPVIVHRNETNKTEIIAVIDSSASMYALSERETRFERAVSDVLALSHEVFAKNGYMSVIVADADPHYLVREVPFSSSSFVYNALEELRRDPSACYYGTSDMTKAMTLCEEVLADNPSAEIQLFTDTTYQYIPAGITVNNVSESDEWNAGILSAKTEVEDIYQILTVEIASYGRSRNLTVAVEVSGADAPNSTLSGKPTIELSQPVFCTSGVVTQVIFKYFSSGELDGGSDIVFYPLSENEKFMTYQSIHIELLDNEEPLSDSLSVDDFYDIYGGQKPLLKVQYASSRKLPTSPNDKDNPGPNPFVNAALSSVQGAMRKQGRWDISITEVAQGTEPALEGFDLYIFEHDMPAELPTDGVVFLLNPTTGWSGAGINVMETRSFYVGNELVSVYLMENVEMSAHPVLNNLNGYKVVADNITVTQYKAITYDPSYDVLMTVNSEPIVLVKKSEAEQFAVLSFSVHYSNIPRVPEMAYLFYNLFDYYFPASVDKNLIEVGESIVVNARGPEVTVTGFSEPITELPATITLNTPGSYTAMQTTYYNKRMYAEVFVKVPAWESDIQRTEDSLAAPLRDIQQDRTYDDLLIYLAAALVALLFAEWWLQAHEGK